MKLRLGLPVIIVVTLAWGCSPEAGPTTPALDTSAPSAVDVTAGVLTSDAPELVYIDVPDRCPTGYFVENTVISLETLDTYEVCAPATPGYHVPLGDADRFEQVACSPGSYQPGWAATDCIPARAGSYVEFAASVADTPCRPGTYQPGTGKASCIEADPGTYVDMLGATKSKLCRVGSYQPRPAATGCRLADPGYFVATEGSADETPCDIGTFQPDAGATGCITAPIGTFVDTRAATEARPCPEGSTTEAEGATSIDACEPASSGPGDTDVRAAVDAAVDAGTLVGSGPGNSSTPRLRNWLKALDRAMRALEEGDTSAACAHLRNLIRRSDGAPAPTDHVEGPARAEINAELVELRAGLGCT